MRGKIKDSLKATAIYEHIVSRQLSNKTTIIVFVLEKERIFAE
jgi:hypothetical protein